MIIMLMIMITINADNIQYYINNTNIFNFHVMSNMHIDIVS